MILRTFVPTLLIFVIFLERQICEYQSADTDKNVSLAASDRRHGRFLNLFSVIRFSNVPCTTKIGINGTCYTEKQCSGILNHPKEQNLDYLFREAWCSPGNMCWRVWSVLHLLHQVWRDNIWEQHLLVHRHVHQPLQVNTSSHTWPYPILQGTPSVAATLWSVSSAWISPHLTLLRPSPVAAPPPLWPAPPGTVPS